MLANNNPVRVNWVITGLRSRPGSGRAQRPQFNSILRYLISSHAHLGNIDTAQDLLQRLLMIEPDFSVDSLLASSYPTLDTPGGQDFLAGLVKAGVRRN
jgi:hypothetical protein